jgi:CubicO group peptidase (beta-lactamase class C family)
VKKYKLLVLIITLLTISACGAKQEKITDYSQANQQVDDFFAEFTNRDTPGGAVIVLKDGETIYQSAYGIANLDDNTPLTTDHIFHIASVGKQMTAVGIMMLHEEGKLNYDDAVGKYVPEVEQFGDEFTIRHLLNHTSGMPDYDSTIQDGLYARADEPTNEDLVAVLSEMDELPSTPGDAFEYSNPGYDLLAVVIERISGQSFPKFMQTRIFDPLGMENTFSLPNAQRRADPMVAISYTGENGKPEAYPSDDLDNLYGSGSIYTTIGDMALYDEALYTDQLIPQSTLEEAFQPAELNDGSIEPYGFGWELEKWNGKSYVAHSGAWLGFNSDYVRFAERHFSVIVLLNRDYDYPDDPRIALQIAEFYLK